MAAGPSSHPVGVLCGVPPTPWDDWVPDLKALPRTKENARLLQDVLAWQRQQQEWQRQQQEWQRQQQLKEEETRLRRDLWESQATLRQQIFAQSPPSKALADYGLYMRQYRRECGGVYAAALATEREEGWRQQSTGIPALIGFLSFPTPRMCRAAARAASKVRRGDAGAGR